MQEISCTGLLALCRTGGVPNHHDMRPSLWGVLGQPQDRSRLGTPDERAIALGSYCAAAALGCADLDHLTNQAISLKQAWLIELATQKLSSMLERWRAGGDASGSGLIPDLLQLSIEKLAKPLPK